MEINEVRELKQRKYQIRVDSKTGKYSLSTEGQGGADQLQADALLVASGPKDALSDTLKKLFDLRNWRKQKVITKN